MTGGLGAHVSSDWLRFPCDLVLVQLSRIANGWIFIIIKPADRKIVNLCGASLQTWHVQCLWRPVSAGKGSLAAQNELRCLVKKVYKEIILNSQSIMRPYQRVTSRNIG